MTGREMEEAITAMAAREAAVRPDDRVLGNIRGSVLRGLKPVRPLARATVYTSVFVVLTLAVAFAWIAFLRIYNTALGPGRLALIAAILLIAIAAVSRTLARLMVPGSSVVSPLGVFLAQVVVLEITFLALFHNYSMGGFVHYGTSCLTAGLLWALPVALLAWLFLGRGLIVDYPGAGLMLGALAGLAGVAILELHCPAVTLPHIAVWHGGVLVVSAAAGYLAGLAARRIRRLL